MAKGGDARGKSGKGGKASKAGRPAKSTRKPKPGRPITPGGTAKSRRPAKPATPADEAAAAEIVGTFVLGAIPGATLGGWIDSWRQRMPRCELVLREISVASQRDALADDGLDAAIVRLPIDADGLHVIALYDEVPVVVIPAESHLTAADELELADLAGEVVIRPVDAAFHLEVDGGVAPTFSPPETTEQAIATVAAGVGVVIVPMSLARQHRRKDAAYRPLRDGPRSTVALVWPADATTPAVEAFVGIVRGRTANSSRA
jgi:DNA-binding transcriptional LysR family regulator